MKFIHSNGVLFGKSDLNKLFLYITFNYSNNFESPLFFYLTSTMTLTSHSRQGSSSSP